MSTFIFYTNSLTNISRTNFPELNKIIFQQCLPRHGCSLDLEMEHSRPDEGQHASSETANEAHEDGEVRDDNGKHDGHNNHHHSEAKTPYLQLTIWSPDGRENGFRLSL